ncbi:MAG TPA: hypothetical protein VH598_15075, partial [Verrucomicrobiae bacterium]|nr:hypothetical protein [Verrucomicrobiae bacterium]
MDQSCCGLSRREMIRSLVSGSLLLPAILSQLVSEDARAAEDDGINPLAPKAPHFPSKAKRVIVLYMTGG